MARITVREYIGQAGMSVDDLADRLGMRPNAVNLHIDRALPPRWEKILTGEIAPGPAKAKPKPEPEPIPVNEGDIPEGREHDVPPSRPEGGRVETPPVALNYAALREHIEAGYTMVGAFVANSDPPLGEAIRGNAKKAGEAWAAWIQSEPKIAALLEKMMIATPLGEVIGVHISIGIGYYIGRRAYADAMEQRAAAANAQRESETANAFAGSPPDFLG